MEKSLSTSTDLKIGDRVKLLTSDPWTTLHRDESDYLGEGA